MDKRTLRLRFGASTALLLLAASLASCATTGPYEMEMMPAPAVFEPGFIEPFDSSPRLSSMPYLGMLYATDRARAEEGTDRRSRFYTSESGRVLRLGLARAQLAGGELSRQDIDDASFAERRTDTYALKVTAVEEFGALDRSFHPLADADLSVAPSARPSHEFADLVNRKLGMSRHKDVFIYVPGYKVLFENPVLVGIEFWHYLGYEGVFIAFPWPATPSRWAYLGDAESSELSAYHLRILLEYLAEETDAERIHILAYSQGTRVAASAVHALALKHENDGEGSLATRLRLGQLILVGSDLDRARLALYIADNLLDAVGRLTIYVSEKDRALGLARFLMRRERLGEMFEPEEMSAAAIDFLRRHQNLQIVNVSEAESAFVENGHRYFRKSPWVSSDLLMGLRYDLGPQERGLVEDAVVPVWSFPSDYIAKLRYAVARVTAPE